jgi:serine/threonine-protein kinase
MARSAPSPAAATSFWKTTWFFGAAIMIAGLVLHMTTDVIGTLERRFYDFASVRSSHPPSERIAVIAIDERSLASLGRWPWPRDIHARLIDQLAAARAATIVHTGFFFEPESDRGLRFIHKMRDALNTACDAASTPCAAHEPLTRLIAEAQTALDTDGQLAGSLKNAGNVLLPSLFTPGQQPIVSLAQAAAGIGRLNPLPDVDGVVRQEPLLLQDQTAPSLALLAAASSLHLNVADIKLKPDEPLRIGDLRIRTDGAARMLIRFYKGRDGQPAFVPDSLIDVLDGTIPATRYADKIVVIGVTAAGTVPHFAVPGQSALSPAEITAHTVSNILRGHGIAQPDWGRRAALGAFFLVGVYLLAVWPRLSAGMAALVTALLLFALLGTEFALLSGAALWLPLVWPATLLLAGQLALSVRSFQQTAAPGRSGADEASAARSDRLMGLALQGQGQLDLAFERFRRLPVDSTLRNDLQRLALDFKQQRQFNQAAAVHEHLAAHDRLTQGDHDIKAATPPLPHPSRAARLGRYHVEKELGKGAMGAVYLGKDPTIGRVVAIKTMALGEEFEGQELADARDRFFREAETAGRLQHQNIVTIFDAGEDCALAYIAMEFLQGRDLTRYCKTDQLLPVPTVLSIAARVAQALAYAHRQHVVHRDVKPANVMFDLESDTVKITDFGIARITDARKTKTGLVLGTPSFMSPEQLAGHKVDGRSDIYSLGVMLFQLLTGTLPFHGASMAELMYKIANETAPDIRLARQELPDRLARLIALTLNKQPEARYQDGDHLARDLQAVLSERTVIDLEI